jgi:hypothetical protein
MFLHVFKNIDPEKILKFLAKRENSKWWLTLRWQRKRFFQFKIFKMTTFQKKFLLYFFNVNINFFSFVFMSNFGSRAIHRLQFTAHNSPPAQFTAAQFTTNK